MICSHARHAPLHANTVVRRCASYTPYAPGHADLWESDTTFASLQWLTAAVGLILAKCQARRAEVDVITESRWPLLWTWSVRR